MANLEQYRAKRDFKVTREPSGKAARARSKTAGGIFVIHKHDATRLHYDLRLEHGGVLWSWAVTRGPSLDPSEKRLAVHVEDHPIDYGSFEGNIPKGQYGAGAVIVWDEGSWEPEGDPAAGMKKGHLSFTLKGNKLNGAWHLVRLKRRPKEKRDNWLLIKSDDAFASRKGDILEDAPQSVKSGLSIEDIAEGKRQAKAKPVKARAKPGAGTRKPAKSKAKMPGFVAPCLARLQDKPPAGNEWVHEVKFDGYRMQAHVDGGAVKLHTRTGLDWTAKFGKAIADTLASLDLDQAIIDGEIVVLGDNGVSAFSELQLALSEKRTERMTFYVFDLLFLDGEDLRAEPLVDRKERLRDLLEGSDEEGPVRYSEHFSEPGKTMLSHACRMGLEGVVSKRADASHSSGRGHDWIKSKCTLRQEFVIAGYLPSQAAGRGLRSLVVAYHEDGALKSAGRVGTGFAGNATSDLRKKLDAIRADASAFEGTAAREKGVVWVKPQLVAEIEFRSWTRGGSIRHASFQGLREDKPAEEVVVEKPEPASKPKTAAKTGAAAKPKPVAAAAETSVQLSSPDKKLWPDEGVTKQQLLDHYAAVWPRMRDYVVNRPLALVRAPDGIKGQRFFQKHAMPGMHKSIFKSNDPEDNEEFLFVRDFDGIAGLVQLGVVEIHIWGATVDKIATPDQIVFDLDPDEGLGVEEVRAATLDVKERLDDLGLPNFLKTSGGKGFHVVVPLKPKADWATVKTFSHDFARAMEQTDPKRYTATLSKKARQGRVFIDYLRNGRGSTTVVAYSSRAKTGATVSMPVPWEALDGLSPAAFKIGDKALVKALAADDPWKDYEKRRKLLALNGG
ncbi:bifunctional non-homologous end joining protein LigD [Mesorhizobium albiziae]|uniref:DNA ligase (ATP) n=1 Tax=Neomesorhizobium albiziae TaxID=335020 RepID=A0A1I3VB41_9HYPH|nr:DNA ligase D [Mesorhizobium albiziae]GLS28720.1 ATP-dependent DNA ligase [Mesorhizobium albiziae]SFJ91407.1 bifunctional non-homologous end joining protein LigD [Mesorhizobium albiziae]